MKISVQLVLMPSSAKRLIASRPFSDIATLTTMFGASLAKCRPSSSIPSTSSETTSAETGTRGDLADLLEDLVVRATDLGVEGRIGGHAVEDAPAGDGLDLFDIGGVQEDLHRAGSKGASASAADSSPRRGRAHKERGRPRRPRYVRADKAASDGRDRLDAVGRCRRVGPLRHIGRAGGEDRLATVADGKRRGDEAVEQRVRPLGS